MSDSSHTSPSSHLEPPQKGRELEDPGAQESASEDEHFSDASEGQPLSRSRASSRAASPVPLTRVERVDDEPRHGEVPGTAAYEKRIQDAVPDEIEIVTEGSRSRSVSQVREILSFEDATIPRTVVVKVDENPSHGEIPGTEAYDKRKADAVPDLIFKTSLEVQLATESHQGKTDQPVPETRLSRVDSLPRETGSSEYRAHRRSPSDTMPDVVETVHEATDGGEDDHGDRDGNDDNDDPDAAADDDNDDEFGDDFDEFEEGANIAPADDDFGDFDDGFGETVQSIDDEQSRTAEFLQQPSSPLPIPQLLDLTDLKSLPELLSTTNDSLDELFPQTREIPSLPPLEPIQDSTAIFSSERSLSLWSQLVAPPPLQPPNWVKSRIRRLFLVSLGVPVDLDEILPASKQKKLILPSINPEDSTMSAYGVSKGPVKSRRGDTDSPQNDSTVSVNSTLSRQKSSRRRGQPSPPELDLSAVGRLCSTTDAALGGFTESELEQHMKSLETASTKAQDVLDYWVKRTSELVKEKEAFEGVIENLVNHARRARK